MNWTNPHDAMTLNIQQQVVTREEMARFCDVAGPATTSGIYTTCPVTDSTPPKPDKKLLLL